jgi:hypothetical protein
MSTTLMPEHCYLVGGDSERQRSMPTPQPSMNCWLRSAPIKPLAVQFRLTPKERPPGSLRLDCTELAARRWSQRMVQLNGGFAVSCIERVVRRLNALMGHANGTGTADGSLNRAQNTGTQLNSASQCIRAHQAPKKFVKNQDCECYG